jgi:hypothetical protein
MSIPVRGGGRRTGDTLALLDGEVDAWVATNGPDPEAGPYLVPLSFHWDGRVLLLATAESSRTARNLASVGRVRLSLGTTRDVVLIEGTAEAIPAAAIPAGEAEAFAAKTGFDPREIDTDYTYVRVRPQWVQAWRSVAEQLAGPLMRDGTWLVPGRERPFPGPG